METRTPKFSSLLAEVLSKVTSSVSNTCRTCKSDFSFAETEINIFKKHQVSPPKNCSSCRRRQRLAFANYTTLFKRPCDVPGHTEDIVSLMPRVVKFPVWDFNTYWSDARKPMSYTIPIDMEKPFLGQLEELYTICPQAALTYDPASVNSEYTAYGNQFKNCYYLFGGLNTENVMYSVWGLNTRDSIDVLIALNSEQCYECVFPDHCSNCSFALFSKECLDSALLFDCRGCTHCFGCVNLRNKKYCFFNEQLTEAEYTERMSEIDLGKRSVLDQYLSKFLEFIKTQPVRATRNSHEVDCSGNYLIYSKNCHETFWAIQSENIIHGDFLLGVRDSYDVTIAANCEQLYATALVDRESYRTKFGFQSKGVADCEYVLNCRNSKNCFGCVGLENNTFCIFNKQYTEEEYWPKLDEIKTRMLLNGEYGEFFPLSMSPFPYNSTFSGLMYEIGKTELESLGGWTHEEESHIPKGLQTLLADDLPDSVDEVGKEIFDTAILDEAGKPFKISEREFSFYKKHRVSLPKKAPYTRIRDRFDLVSNFKVYRETCVKCSKEIISSYRQTDGYLPYCETCYQKEVL